MVKLWSCLPGLLALLLAASVCFGEDAEPVKFYKLEFVVKEVDGAKVLNSRVYTMLAATKGRGEIRVGSKVPYVSGSIPSNNGVAAAVQYQQVDVGVSVDVAGIKEVQDRLSFEMTAEVSSIAETPASSVNPVIRQNKWHSVALVPLNKPTVVFSSDNLDAKSKMQVEVTAIAIP